jgi:hypothetical protein
VFVRLPPDSVLLARAARVVGLEWWKLAAAMSPGYKGGAQKTVLQFLSLPAGCRVS